MIQNLGQVISELKKKLPDYLEEQGINTKSKLFRCPNFKEHNNEDAKPSANFFPNNESWHCFSCSYKSKLGDIFEAVHLIENKDITGENFFAVVKYLCKKYKVEYKETTTKEEQFFRSISDYLTTLTDNAHRNIQSAISQNNDLKNILTSKQWIKAVEPFKLGYLDKPYSSTVDKDILSYMSLDPKKVTGRIIIPVKNYRGDVVGITTRSLQKDRSNSEVRYKHFISYGLKKLVYNIDRVDPSKEVIVVEGPSSVLTLHTFGIKNSVATFGNFLHEDQYKLLVKKKIKRITFLYDGDAGGNEGLRNSLKSLCKGDIEVSIGFLQEGLDPGDYVIKHHNLEGIKTMSLYDYLVSTYAANTEDKLIEKCFINYLINIKDLVRKEKFINSASKKLKINKSTIADLMTIYQSKSNVSVKDVLKERGALVQTLTDFEKWSWNRGRMLGLRSFTSFDAKLDGVQNGLILLGGKPNIGKSAVLISLAIQLIQKNSNVYLLYFTIDDSMFVTLSRFIANLSELPINIVSNPNYRITKTDLPEHVKQDYISRREKAMSFLRSNASFINLKDNSEGSTIETIKEKVKAVAPLTEGKQLVVFIDNLHNLRSNKFVSDRHLYSLISNELNNIANDCRCPVISSTHITKDAIRNKQFDGNAIKETVQFFYDSKLILFIDTDEEELEGTRDDLEVNIIVSKNKFSGFKGYMPFVFYRSLSKVKEVNSTDEKGLFT